MQHIHIIGSGAMACLWGSYFPSGTSLTFINRNGKSEPFQYQITPTNKIIKARTQPASEITSIHRLIVATKAFDALNAVKSLGAKLSEQCEIVVLQNGMGSQQAIANAFNHLAIYACSSTEGAYKANPNEVVHAGKGENTIGRLTEPATEAQLSQWLPSVNFKWTNDIEPVLWKKLLINCAINPLTAIFQCQNGELLENPEALLLMKQVCHELDTLTTKLNLGLDNSFEMAQAVCRMTAQNFSSMYQDVHHGRQTEINYITGYIIQQCKLNGVACSANQSVYKQINVGDLG